MTFPCIDTAYFDAPGGEISPKRHWQFEHRASATVSGWTFTPANNAAGTTLGFVQAQWLNSTPVAQQVYAVLTADATRYAIDQLKHLVIQTQWGTSFGAAPADPTLTEESRVRGYLDFGTTTVSSTTVGVFGMLEDRQPKISTPIGDVITLPAGQTMKARAQVRWFTSAWGLDWYSAYGDPVAQRIAKVGALQIDLFSTPVIP